ncbi:MAG: MBL fold metallo-hydrolase [Bacteroidetes bacterium]|nr:MBL fold metallo-hydrolase [Bacteroidota bacterium]MBS1540092.1 MBL fold metallo-hydrolase [Bacteroidota bacterium]
MSLLVASLNSGSNGNCYYIGNNHEAVLVDCGISHREVVRRLKRLNLSIENVKAIFITHEHNDHVAGVAVVSRKHQIPVYISAKTRQHFNFEVDEKLICTFESNEEIKLGNLAITSFPKQHDAVDAHSVIVQSKNTCAGVFTDLGKPCRNAIRYFKLCHAAFLETNYDEEMLEAGSYPLALKNRVRGDYGHLSNKQALKLFIDHRPPFMSHLFLSHLSQNNNSPTLVENLFQPWAGETEIIIASRKNESALYRVGKVHYEQLQLF